MIKIEVVFFYPLHRPSMKEPAKIYYSTCVQIHRRYTDYHTVWNQYHRNAHLMQQIYDIYSNRFNYITLNIYNVSLFKINDCCMKYAWEFFFMSTSAGIFSLYWCNIQSPATVRQQTYKWGTPSDGWSWMSTSLCKHYTSHRLSLREMYRHSLQNNKTAYLV